MPFPSHERTPVAPSPSQVPALHSVPLTNWRQAPLPSQVPSSPQLAGVLAGQTRESLGLPPDGMKKHSPRWLARLHALQVSPQALVQQIPSAQKPLWHSPSQVQDSAFPLDLVNVPVRQALGWEASDVFASFFPPPPPPSSTLVNLLLVQAAAPRTAARTRAPHKDFPAKGDCNPCILARHESALIETPPRTWKDRNSLVMNRQPNVVDGF